MAKQQTNSGGAQNVDEETPQDPYSDVTQEVEETEDGQEEEQEERQPVLRGTKSTLKEDEDLNEQAHQIAQIEALAKIDPSVKDLPEYKNLMKAAEKIKGKPAKSAKQVVERREEEEDEYEEEEEEDFDAEEDNDDVDVFGVTREEEDAVEIEIDDTLADFIETKYAVKVEKFFDTVDKLRNQNQELSEKADDYDELAKTLAGMPAPVKAAFTAVTEGKDYVSAFNSATTKLDFNKDFDSQDKNKVVKNYFSEGLEKIKAKLEAGKIDDDDYEEQIELLYNSAKPLFTKDKESFNKQRADMIKNQEELQKNFQKSAISSVEKLKEQYPNFSRADLQRVRQRLVDGNIEDTFFNKDGTYKPDAAEKLALAEFGKTVIQELLKSAETRGESRANERIVNRGKKKMTPQKSQQGRSKDAANAIGHLNSAFQDDPYS